MGTRGVRLGVGAEGMEGGGEPSRRRAARHLRGEWHSRLTAERRLSMRVSQTSCPPSSFVAQSGPPKPSAQMHTPRLWGAAEGGSGGADRRPRPVWLAHPPPIPGYKSLPHCGHCSSQDTEPCGSGGQPSPGDIGRVQHLRLRPGAHTPGGPGSSRGPPTRSGQSPRKH